MNTTQQLKDQLCSSNHLLIPPWLPAYRKGVIELAGEFGVEFPGRKPLLSVDDGEGDTLPFSQPSENGWQDWSPEERGTHALCCTLCALVLLLSPLNRFQQLVRDGRGRGAAIPPPRHRKGSWVSRWASSTMGYDLWSHISVTPVTKKAKR